MNNAEKKRRVQEGLPLLRARILTARVQGELDADVAKRMLNGVFKGMDFGAFERVHRRLDVLLRPRQDLQRPRKAYRFQSGVSHPNIQNLPRLDAIKRAIEGARRKFLDDLAFASLVGPKP